MTKDHLELRLTNQFNEADEEPLDGRFTRRGQTSDQTLRAVRQRRLALVAAAILIRHILLRNKHWNFVCLSMLGLNKSLIGNISRQNGYVDEYI